MKVKLLREKLHLANAYRMAANSLTWGVHADGVTYDVCVCGAKGRKLKPGEMRHADDCLQVELRHKADRIETDIESETERAG